MGVHGDKAQLIRRETTMKSINILLLAAMTACCLLGADGAEAGLFDRWNKKEPQKEAVPRYDLLPSMTFYKGVLGYGVANSWELDDVQLQFVSDCVVTSELSGDGGLQAGQEALVMGSRIGDTIIAHRVRIVKPDYMNEGMPKSGTVSPCEADPTVGEGTGPE